MRPKVDLPDPDGPSMAMIMISTQTPQRLRSTSKRPLRVRRIKSPSNSTSPLRENDRVVAMLGAQVDAKRFAVLAQIDAAHHSHSEEQRFRAQIDVRQLVLFDDGRLALLDASNVSQTRRVRWTNAPLFTEAPSNECAEQPKP
jgi:hypothetical protein